MGRSHGTDKGEGGSFETIALLLLLRLRPGDLWLLAGLLDRSLLLRRLGTVAPKEKRLSFGAVRPLRPGERDRLRLAAAPEPRPRRAMAAAAARSRQCGWRLCLFWLRRWLRLPPWPLPLPFAEGGEAVHTPVSAPWTLLRHLAQLCAPCEQLCPDLHWPD